MLLKPHRLLLSLAAILCVAELIRTLIFGNEVAVDMPIHDTFYVFDSFHITLVLVLLFLGMAFLYKMGAQSHFQYNKWLTLGHFASVCLFILTLLKLTSISPTIPRMYFGLEEFHPMKQIYKDIDFFNKWLFIFALLSMVFFILNLIVGYLKRKNN